MHLIPYLDYNESPVRFTKTGAMPFVFAGPEDIRKTLAAPLTAGEVDLQDGWAHFVRGHFADAITSFVTAIEVTLDAAIERDLVAQGASATEREERLAKTFNNFDARFSDYLRIAKRAAPGPIVSIVPYIHGLRLRQEFSRTRGLRHKVVHEGLRLSSTVRGPALRVAETTTWLFDWINAGNRAVKRPNHPEKLGLAGEFIVETVRTPEGIKVVNPRREPPPGEVFGLDTAVFNRLRSAIDGTSQDVVVFFESALRLLKLELRRKPSEQAKTIGVIAAYDIAAEGGLALALLADLDGLVDAATLEAATGAVLEESLAQARVLKGLLVVNHQRHLALEARERAAAVSEGIVALAARRGISIMTAADLWEWLIICRGNDTRYAAAREMVTGLPSGRIGSCHPHYRPVGVVRHYYAGPSVVSIQLDAAQSLAVGMIVAIRLRSGLREIACKELQVDRCAVQQTLPGACVGVKLDCPRNEVCLDEVAFLVRDGGANRW